ncbi:MAG: hypothetical protein ABGZ53_29420 [Fuerstiella sp.]
MADEADHGNRGVSVIGIVRVHSLLTSFRKTGQLIPHVAHIIAA